MPVVANGDIRNEADVERVTRETGVGGEHYLEVVLLVPSSYLGVMSARGILNNPALYAGHSYTPFSCIKEWIDLSLSCGVTFSTFHHHLLYMLDQCTSRTEKRVFNTLTSVPAVLDYLEEHYSITYTPSLNCTT